MLKTYQQNLPAAVNKTMLAMSAVTATNRYMFNAAKDKILVHPKGILI